MNCFLISIKNKKVILALGPESAGNFSIYKNGKIYFSKSFGDLLEEKNFLKFKKSVLDYLKKNKIKPDIILTDLHPLYKTTALGAELAKKFKARHLKIQHHLAHIFSAIGEKTIIENCKLKIENCIGIACDGTGYGLDGKIWGGEIFKISNLKFPISNKIPNSKFQIQRIGHLENQIMISGDMAVKEPARMLIAILAKIKIRKLKNVIFNFVKNFYSRNQFEFLYNQFQQGFNCQETSSAGRILDAVSILLGFCKNQRNYKHEPIDLLEKNSNVPYKIRPKIFLDKKEKKYMLLTTPLFEYLIKNLHRDKKRLAATAQLYIAQGLYQICQMSNVKCQKFFSGGIANNKIISSYLEFKGIFINKFFSRNDDSLSFGQIIYYLLVR
ncbi:MAG: hypothetical protein AAB653_03625 [Patescibacteria group bacterium]